MWFLVSGALVIATLLPEFKERPGNAKLFSPVFGLLALISGACAVAVLDGNLVLVMLGVQSLLFGASRLFDRWLGSDED